MTINFSGITNGGSIKYGTGLDSAALTNQKIWAKLTNKNGNHLDEFRSLVDKDNIANIDFSTHEEALGDSFLSINGGKKINFKNIKTEDVPIVLLAKKFFEAIADPKTELELEEHYLKSKKAFDNTEFEGFNDFTVKDMIEIVDISHNRDFLKDSVKEGIETLNSKLSQAFD